MATYHCKLNKGKGTYGLQHANYILREGRYSAEQSGREDLIYKESGNLPEWASSPQEFWKAAGLYERVNAVKYYELEIALPNELSNEKNIKIVQDYVKKVVGDKPYTFAIHDKPAALNEEIRQPHAHIMFSERVAEKGIEYTKEQFFKRYNPRHPERGGAKKDNRFIVYGTEIIYQIRKDLENIINENYEKNGYDVRVSSATLNRGRTFEACSASVNKISSPSFKLFAISANISMGKASALIVKSKLCFFKISSIFFKLYPFRLFFNVFLFCLNESLTNLKNNFSLSTFILSSFLVSDMTILSTFGFGMKPFLLTSNSFSTV